MKNIFYSLLFSIMMVSCNSKPIDLHVMTFNIRYDNPGDSLNSWAYRKDIAAEVISQNNIDLLGTQEVLAHQLKDLETRLPGYKALGVGREDGKEKGEYCAILYKKDRFDEIKSGHFWLSETPEVAGSKGWDGACERIATWVVLKDKESKKELFFINTHLDHIGKAARREGVALLLNRAKETGKGLPVIITGDFNAEPESDVIKHVLENGAFSDSRLVSPVATGIAGTFNDFGRIPAEKRDYIDYIFVTKEFTVYSYEVLPEKKGETYYSDHAPVVAKMTLH